MKTGKMQTIDENVDNIAESYLKKYRGYVEMHESRCQKAAAGVPVSSADIVAFGQQLDMWNAYHEFCESNGTLAQLGPMPKIALDVVAAVQTKNVLPLVSSQQPIDEIRGTVYAKKLVAVHGSDGANGSQGMGGVSQGQTLNSTLKGDRVHDPLFGAARQRYSAANPLETTAGAALEYTINLGRHLLPETVKLELVDTVNSKKYIWHDAGDGTLLGNLGNIGAVNYDTGQIDISFASAPTDGLPITGTCDVNVEAEPDMVTIGTGYDPISIDAEFFGLKSEMSMLNNFSFTKRWGRSSADEQAQDLANELTNTMNAAGIDRLVSAFSGGAANTSMYDRTPPSAVSVAEHKLSFVDTTALAEGKLSTRAGRGVINRYICGSTGAATLKGMPGFVPNPSGSMQQVGLYGTLDGIPVIRATDAIINQNRVQASDDDIYGIYMGAGTFDTPMVQATYLPIFVTGTMNFSNNPLKSHQGIGTMCGLKTCMDRYITRIALKKSA